MKLLHGLAHALLNEIAVWLGTSNVIMFEGKRMYGIKCYELWVLTTTKINNPHGWTKKVIWSEIRIKS